MMVKSPSRDDLYLRALACPACKRLLTTMYGYVDPVATIIQADEVSNSQEGISNQYLAWTARRAGSNPSQTGSRSPRRHLARGA